MTIKKITTTMFVLTILMFGLARVMPVSAQTTETSGKTGMFAQMVEFISQKFGLDKTQVETAMNEFHTQQKATRAARPVLTTEERQKLQKERLDKLVTEGKITQDQAGAILTELTRLHTKYAPETMADKTHEERHAQKEAMHEEIVTWAKAQGIDSSYVMGFGRHR